MAGWKINSLGKLLLLVLFLVFLLFYQSVPSVFAQKQTELYLKGYSNQSAKTQPTASGVTPIPTPVYIPKNATDREQLLLIQQIQKHLLLTNQIFLLSLLLVLPIPISWRLNIYNLINRLALPWLPSNTIALLVIIGPVPLIICGYFAVKGLIGLLRKLIPHVFALFGKKILPKQLLQLIFPADTGKSAYATQQLYTLLHTLARQKDTWSRLSNAKNEYSLEIVSTKDQGIRYLLACDTKFADIIKRNLMSYLPGIQIKDTTDYVKDYVSQNGAGDAYVGIKEFKLASHFALPLGTQKILTEHDPISYLTGNMTRLSPRDLISFQVVISPLLSGSHDSQLKEMRLLKQKMYQGEPLTPILNKGIFQILESLPVVSLMWWGVKIAGNILWGLLNIVAEVISSTVHGPSKIPTTTLMPQTKYQQILNPYEQELSTVVKGKIDQPLFETSIRLLVVSKDPGVTQAKLNGLLATLGQLSSPYQSLTTKSGLFSATLKNRLAQFSNRSISGNSSLHPNPILSTSELADLFHFPFTNTTKTEGLVKVHSQELPAPLSLKRETTQLDVIVGKNMYGGQETPVGLTKVQRHEHTYIVGKTGMGKTTIIKKMAYQDIVSGKGVAVIDPHGDLVKELLTIIPEARKNDVIYLDPTDKLWPVGLNILAPGGTFVDEEEKADWITGSVISVFMKITPKANWGQRMEHILRNATLTALTTETPTLMTIQKLLTNKAYRQGVTATLKDPVLKQFWADEFKMYGNMQKADIISPLTNKLGEFITSPMSRHILLQAESTIKLSEIMDQGKVLLVNLSKGNLGEERSSFFGTLIISLIQMAAYQRAQIPESQRKDFFLYIDEFQNFATSHFADIFSEARKFHVFIIPSHQNVAQIEDVKTAKVVLGNSGTIISLKNGPDDEAVILPFMAPEVEKGQIINLPPHHFFMKVTNEDSEDAFSGVTIPLDIEGSDSIRDFIITNTRKHYATPRAMVEKQLDILFEKSGKPVEKTSKNTERVKQNSTEVKNKQKSGNYAPKHGF